MLKIIVDATTAVWKLKYLANKAIETVHIKIINYGKLDVVAAFPQSILQKSWYYSIDARTIQTK